ncbi:MAG TPA: ATP-binding protein [Bacteroidales bacterium]|nr:ATP-binding protein [Bacteroidales bacterium]
MNSTAEELFDILNDTDECPWIEAKGIGDTTTSIMETVCSYSNEPGLGGGYILMSISADDSATAATHYKVDPMPDPDKIQSDIATQCASMFNIPVRPAMTIEKIYGMPVLKIRIDELPAKFKPLYFKKDKLPFGALRRIGSTDQHCTDDDMHVFYQDIGSYDQTPVKGTSIADVDENALKRYRLLREKVNPAAEELTYSDNELLEALGCVNKENPIELDLAGLLLFGNSKIQRSTFPMLRADYIRVPGNIWVENPDERFTTIDMRGPLILVLYRLIDAINADLPKGFLLPEDDVQAASTGLPMKALREAIVNALMHRSYREHRPTQIIRYDNRIEIINPGFSLKSEEKLGLPGSETRNPFIAAVFHDTNLAETKGSGIRAMRRMMQAAHLAPPTFESSRENNEFASRLLLHHFLDANDIEWLKQFERFDLADSQKQALIFVREVGAIDNTTYRQMADCDTLKASNDLRLLKTYNLLKSRGKGKATYYVAGDELSVLLPELSTPPPDLKAPATELSTPPAEINTPPREILERINALNKREHDKRKVESIILDLCSLKPMKAAEIARHFNRKEAYFKRKYLSGMIAEKKLKYLYPEMINHPEQAYLTNNRT